MPFVTHAQNFEDLILYRALKDVKSGFYIDVGANSPTAESVTKAFYDRGWSGINVEPDVTIFASLVDERPRDINLNVAVWREAGDHTLYLVDGISAFSTLEPAMARLHREAGRTIREVPMRTTTLVDICNAYVGDRTIHFLKVDVEGGEYEAFQGHDFARWRPWIILGEAHGPDFDAVHYLPWERHLEKNGYSFVYTDGLNRFFVADEHLDKLAKHFRAPPNVYDDWIRASEDSLRIRAEGAEARAHEWAQMLIERSAEAEALRAEVTALRQSTSWRLTAPLRALRGHRNREGANIAPKSSAPVALEPTAPAKPATAPEESSVGREPVPAPRADLPGEVQAVDLHGTRFNVADSATDFGSFWTRVASGAWEPETFSLIERLANPGAPFVDIGAWIGPTTLFAAARGSIVHAYECDPVALEHLHRNIAVNPDLVPRITVSETAVGEANGRMQLWSVEAGNSETSLFARHERDGAILHCAESIEVEVVDAAALFCRHGYAADPAAFIKIDIEGAEFRVVPRLAPLIAGSAAVWYISFHELNINPTDVPARALRIAEMLRTLITFAPLRWYDTSLKELDRSAVLDAVIRGDWPANGSLVFASRDLAA